jgi:hypothetical protein
VKAKVLRSVRNAHLVGLVGDIQGERLIGDNLHYHMTFPDYLGTDYHFLSDNVEIVEDSNAQVDAS